MAKNWISQAVQRPGALRKTLHVKSGDHISSDQLHKAAKKHGITGRRARLAITLKSFHK